MSVKIQELLQELFLVLFVICDGFEDKNQSEKYIGLDLRVWMHICTLQSAVVL